MLASVTICNDELVIKIVEINGLGSLTLFMLYVMLYACHINHWWRHLVNVIGVDASMM